MSVEDILQKELEENASSLWLQVWDNVVRLCVAESILQRVNVEDGSILQGWSKFDDLAERVNLIGAVVDIEDRCIAELMHHSARLNDAVVRSGYNKRTQPTMERHLRIIVPGLVRHLRSSTALAVNPFPATWKMVADLLAQRAYAETGTGYNSQSEPRLLNILLLAGFFVACQLPEAALVEHSLNQLSNSMISIRGSLVRIVENIDGLGVQDKMPPLSSRSGGIHLRHAHLSDLLRAIADESRKVAAGDGVMHRITHGRPLSILTSHSASSITEEQMQRARDIAYRQYEYTLTAYMAIASIEQLIRAWARNNGAEVLRGCLPRDLASLIPTLRCSVPLQQKLWDLFDSHGANIRSRVMHGGLLDVQNKRPEYLLTIADPSKYRSRRGLVQDHYAPENICQFCLECLELLDMEVGYAVTLTANDLDWVGALWLTPAEIDVGRYVHCDFLDDETSTSDWWMLLSTYLNAVMPNVKQFFSVGFIGWIGHGADRFVRLMAAVLVFEALYRTTVHLHGIPVLQVSGARHIQYQMLDRRQLCSPVILDSLVESLPTADRVVAKQVYELTVKARNAFAHGAVPRLNGDTVDCVGHLLVKSVQALVGAGIHGMTKVAAYYRWKNVRNSNHGFAFENWLAGEDQIFNTIKRFADL